MAEFSYVAIASDGKEKKGSMEAVDEAFVKAKLKNEGLIPIKVTAQNMLTRDINISIGNSIKPRDLSIFCRQFNSILNAGVTVVEALGMLGEQTENKVFKKAIGETKTAVEKGETLSDAMSVHKNVFPSLMINLVEAGESSGSLDTAFGRLAIQFEKQSKLSGLVKKAMIYPIILVVVAVVVVIIMSVAVIPKFAEMFSDMGSELPTITKFVLAISDFLIYKWYLLIIIVAGIVGGCKLFAETDKGKHVFGTLKIKLPVFGKLSIKSSSASFSRTLCTLVSSGLSLSDALDITARSMDNILFKEAIDNAKTEVERGVSLSEPIKDANLFPPMVYHMLRIGEETGNIEGMLEKVAEYYEEEVELTTQSLTAALEPLIIVVMGVIVGVLVLAIYMPMINMYSGLENL